MFVMIMDDQGEEYDIVWDNMFFGLLVIGDYGIYFIGYLKYLWVMEKMFECMFVGVFEGKYDWILDFLWLVIGSIFFVLLIVVLVGLEDVDD